MRKLFLVGVLIVALFCALPLFGQSSDTVLENTETPPINVESKTEVSDFLKEIDAPKIIKNNVRVNNVIITKIEINANNQLLVEGTADIQNYANTDTSRLYMMSYTGIKGDRYYLQYPLYTEERSEPFVLGPKDSLRREFRIIEKNFLHWGMGAVEILVEDEYNQMVHKEIGMFPVGSLINIQQTGKLFTDFTGNLLVNDKSFPLGSGPTFTPESQDMFLEIDFGSTPPDFVDTAEIYFYERNFFTKSLKKLSVDAVYDEYNVIRIQIPEDFKAGVYPFQVILEANDGRYIPRLYGRFIRGGNMAKTIDVTFNVKNSLAKGMTVAVQGNPPDMSDRKKDQTITFAAEIIVLGENDTVLFTEKVYAQKVDTYRNVDINFHETIKASKIKKVQVHLSDKIGVFSTFEKQFNLSNDINYWILLYVLGGIFLVLLLIKMRNKHLITVLVMLLVMGNFGDKAQAGITPLPDVDDEIGYFSYDAWDLKPYQSWGVDYYYDDIDVLTDSSVLTKYGISINVLQPKFKICYLSLERMNVSIDGGYTLCSNSPINTCNKTDGSGNPVPCDPGQYDAADDALLLTATGSYSPGSYLTLPYRDDMFDDRMERVPKGGCFYYGGYCGFSYPSDNLPLRESYIGGLSEYISDVEDRGQYDTWSMTPTTATAVPDYGYLLANQTAANRIYEAITDFSLYMKGYSSMPIEFTMNGLTGNAQSDYYIYAPFDLGQYSFYVASGFETKLGKAGYMAKYDFEVCDPTVNPPIVSCQVSNPNPAVGQMVTFTLDTANLDLDLETSYNWEGSIVSSNTYTRSFDYSGVHTLDVVVRNGSEIFRLDPPCSVDVLGNICSTTAPAVTGSMACNDGPAPSVNNQVNTFANTCSDTKACDWTCAPGFINIGGLCVAPPPIPTGLNAAQSACGNYWLDISWNASAGATSYTLYRGVTMVYSGPNLTFRDTNLIPRYSYSYTITASNAQTTSAESTPPVRGIVSSPCDSCDNFDDIQTGIPTGFVRSGTNDCTCS